MRQRARDWCARRLALFSGRRVLQGVGLAALVGVPLGILTGWNTLVRTVVDPSIQLLRPVPITRPSMPDRIEDLDEASPLARPMLCGPSTEKLRSAPGILARRARGLSAAAGDLQT